MYFDINTVKLTCTFRSDKKKSYSVFLKKTDFILLFAFKQTFKNFSGYIQALFLSTYIFHDSWITFHTLPDVGIPG